MENKLYTSSEAATILGISANTVRSWLSRYPQAFEVGVHLVEQSGKRVWTETGLSLLRQRVEENATPFNDAVATKSEMSNVAESDEIATESEMSAVSNSDAMPNIANETATSPTTNNDADRTSFSDAMVNAFTDKLAVELSASIAEKLPERILFHINRMLHQPAEKERVILQVATEKQLQQLPGIEKKYLALPQSTSK